MYRVNSLILFVISFSNFILFTTSDFPQGIDPRIIGGEKVKINEYPFMVSIRRSEIEEILGNGNVICGGALISDNKVITAAHCMFDQYGNLLSKPYSFTIWAGTEEKYFFLPTTQTRTSMTVFVHPDYSPETMYNDIAIMELSIPVIINSNTTNFVNLSRRAFPEGTKCTVLGWGRKNRLNENFPDIPETLHKAEVFIMNKTQCIQNYAQSTDSYNINNKQICVGTKKGDKDSCQGDSGGPLICEGLLYGVVSTGKECALKDYPGIYTDITKYIDFIEAPSTYNNSAFKIHFFGCKIIIISFSFFTIFL